MAFVERVLVGFRWMVGSGALVSVLVSHRAVVGVVPCAFIRYVCLRGMEHTTSVERVL